jgi:hypothetical protein
MAERRPDTKETTDPRAHANTHKRQAGDIPRICLELGYRRRRCPRYPQAIVNFDIHVADCESGDIVGR